MAEDEYGRAVMVIENVVTIAFSQSQDETHATMLEQHTRRMLVATLLATSRVHAHNSLHEDHHVKRCVALADRIIEATK